MTRPPAPSKEMLAVIARENLPPFAPLAIPRVTLWDRLRLLLTPMITASGPDGTVCFKVRRGVTYVYSITPAFADKAVSSAPRPCRGSS